MYTRFSLSQPSCLLRKAFRSREMKPFLVLALACEAFTAPTPNFRQNVLRLPACRCRRVAQFEIVRVSLRGRCAGR